MQPELKVRKILGRTYLNENKLTEALDVLVRILIDYPDDLETILTLAACYLAGGDGKTAKELYLRAQQLDPESASIAHQIRLAEELHYTAEPEPIPTDLDAIGGLLQRLTGQSKVIPESEILRAATLLDTIIHSDSPADQVATHLDQIDDLLQALVEINIRQARADGRTDLADGLRSLQLNIDCQRMAHAKPVALAGGSNLKEILMLLPHNEKCSKRLSLVKATLENLGYGVTTQGWTAGIDRLPDVVLTSNPHVNPQTMHSVAELAQRGVPILLDLETDYRELPVTHPDYGFAGLGTQERSDTFTAALALADLISVPAQVQAAALGEAPERIRVIPDGWTRENMLWEKKAADRGVISLGWVSTSGELDDLMLLRRYIIRVLREYDNTRLVIIGNPQAYRLFESLPERRRQYIPLVADDEFPYLLSQLDVLLVPLRNVRQNTFRSDTILMEAGVRGLPWVASSVPAFRDWGLGGMIPETLDEWHLSLRHLVEDGELRATLGRVGQEAARTREMAYLGKLWVAALDELSSRPRLAVPVLETAWQA